MIQEALLPSDEDVQFFLDQGYWIGGVVLTEERLARLRQAMDEVYSGRYDTGREPWNGGWKPGGDPTTIRKTDNSHWSNRTLRCLALDPTIGAMAARLMGTSEVRLWHDQLLFKPGLGASGGSAAGNVGWHQDNQYWQCTDPDLITAWVAFDDVDEQNGCMQFIPRSHQWGLITEGNFFDHDLEAQEALITQTTGRTFRPVPCRLKAGQVSFHHCRTLHGSGPNFTDRPRRSLVIHLMPDHARYIAGTPSDGHMNVQILKQRGGREGDRFVGEPWPVLYSEKV